MKPPAHPPIVLVEWIDAASATSAWDDRDTVARDGVRFATDPILATGFLIVDRPDVIVVAQSLNHHADHVAHATAIPRVAVRKITTLRAARGWDVADG